MTAELTPPLAAAIATFGEDVAYLRDDAGEWRAIRGIFDDAYKRLDPLGGPGGGAPIGVMSSRPILTIMRNALSAFPEKDDLLRVRGRIYNIVEVRPDSGGGIVLDLVEEIEDESLSDGDT